MRNLTVAARMHRYVHGGISAAATRQFDTLCCALAVLHDQDYLTPRIIDLAFTKTYLHRLILATDKTEKSLQWGSQPEAVALNMQGVTVDMALDAIIDSVAAPT